MDVKRFYAAHCKKFLALFLAFVCLVTATLSPAIVFANDDMYVFKPEYTKIQGLMDYIMSGVMGVFPGDFNTFYENNKEAYDAWYDKVYGYNYTDDSHAGGGRELTIKADDMQDLYDLVNKNVWATCRFWLVEPVFSNLTELCTYYDKLRNLDLYEKYISSSDNFFFFVNGNNTLYTYSPDKRYDLAFYKSFDSICFLNSDSTYAETVIQGLSGSSVKMHSAYKFNYVGTHPMKIFYSYDDYLAWKNGQNSKVYFSSNYYNYSPTDLTINSDTVKNYTENNTTNKIYNETVNNITNQGGEPSLTQDEVQKIVDDAVQKVLDSMPTPTPEPTDTPIPTPGGGGSGGDSGGGSSGGTTDSSTKEFFQKICDYFEENNKKLEDIVNLIDTAGKSDCNYDYSQISEFLTTLWNESDKKFDTMINLLEKNNEYQEKMLDSLNQIKALLVVDTVLDVFKDRSSETANKAKEKFPTSVPWDVAMIVNAMSAEPQAPVMKLPLVLKQFGISEEITIDLSTDEWEKLAKLCRYMLSLLFLLFMVHLTRKLFYKDGDD